MKKFSRLLSALLAVMLIVGLVPMTAAAADTPTLSLNVVSETSSKVTVSIKLDSGSFLAADVSVKLNSTNFTCTSIYTSEEIDTFEKEVKREGNNAIVSAAYKETMKCSIATTKAFDKSAPIFIFEFSKASSKNLAKADIELKCSSFKDGSGNVVSPKLVNNVPAASVTLPAPTVTGSNVASTGKNKLTWNAVSGAASYKVYRATSKTGNYSLLKTTTSTSFTNTGAVAGTTYYYKVRAVDASGKAGTYSSVVTRTCDYAKPTNVKISGVSSTGKNKITWDAVDGATSYKVYRSTDNSSYSLLKTTTSTSFTNTGAVAGTKYYYKVKACGSNSAANSAYSSYVVRTCDYAKPTNVKISGVSSTGKNKITWDAVDGATAYKVYRSTSKDGTYSLIKTTTSTSFTNTGAVAGTKYYYKVKACGSNSAADSAYSSYVVRTCDLARPTASITLTSAGKPKVTWNKVDNAVSYKVYRSTSADGTYSLMKTTTSASYTNTSAVAGTTYFYKVVAVHSNTAANSAKSTAVSITAK